MNYNEVIDRQFTATLEREGQTVTDYFTGKNIKVIFVRGAGKVTQEALELFTARDNSIPKGGVFTFQGNNYVVMNRGSIESNVYYRSTAYKCDTVIPVKQPSGLYKLIPFCSQSEKYGVDSNKYLSVINGSVVVFTGLNDFVENLATDSICRAYGGTYKAVNHFYSDGLAYIYMTRETNTEDLYEVTCTEKVGDLDLADKTKQLAFVATKNGFTVDAALSFASSDPTIATIDSNGKITMLKAGQIKFTATWPEQNVSCVIETKVVAADTYIATIEAKASTVSTTKVCGLTAYLYKYHDDVTGTVTWTWAETSNVAAMYITLKPNGNKAVLSVSASATKGEVIHVTATSSQGAAVSYDVTIV